MWTPAALLEVRMASVLADVGDINHSLQPQTLFWPKPRVQWLVITNRLSRKAQADLHMEQNSCFHAHHIRLPPTFPDKDPWDHYTPCPSTTNSEF